MSRAQTALGVAALLTAVVVLTSDRFAAAIVRLASEPLL